MLTHYESSPWQSCPRPGAGHNSDLKDYHEYMQKQVWGEQICSRHCLLQFYSPHTLRTIVNARKAPNSELCCTGLLVSGGKYSQLSLKRTAFSDTLASWLKVWKHLTWHYPLAALATGNYTSLSLVSYSHIWPLIGCWYLRERELVKLSDVSK